MEQPTIHIKSILELDLVTIAFAMIPRLKNYFELLLEDITHHKAYDGNDMRQTFMNQLKDEFINRIMSELEIVENVKIYKPTAYSSINISEIVFCSKHWMFSLDTTYDRIMCDLNKHYYDFDFALANLSKFSTKFFEYMNNFANANNCSRDSKIYIQKMEDFKKNITANCKKYVATQQGYYDYAYDNDYDFDIYHTLEKVKTYFETSPDFMLNIDIIWVDSIIDYIQIENQKFDNSNVSFSVEINEKERKRKSYERRKKNAHKHNKYRKVYV